MTLLGLIFRSNGKKNLTAFKKYQEREKEKQKQASAEQLENERSVFGHALSKEERALYHAYLKEKARKREKTIKNVRGAVKKVGKYSSGLPSLSYDNFGGSNILDVNTTRKRRKSLIEL